MSVVNSVTLPLLCRPKSVLLLFKNKFCRSVALQLPVISVVAAGRIVKSRCPLFCLGAIQVNIYSSDEMRV